MMFLALMGFIVALGWVANRVGVPGLGGWPARMRLGMAGAFAMAGIDHIASPERYLAMIETWLPYPAAIVAFTGLCEMAGAIGLLAPRLRHAAGLALAVYLVAVFPANIANAVQGIAVDGLPTNPAYYWARLALQPLFVWWALYAAEVVRWPRRRPIRAMGGATGAAVIARRSGRE